MTVEVLPHRARYGRALGAVAGLVPAIAVSVLYAMSGSSEGPVAMATGIVLVGLIGTTAGLVVGPLAASEPRRLLAAALAYAIALICVAALLSIVQGVGDAIAADGFDPLAIVAAAVGRAGVAIAGVAYLILPAVVVGLGWSVATRWLTVVAWRFDRGRG
jgi:hypothetical protein